MITKSNITGKFYQSEDMYFFRNHVQSAYYIEWGAELVDLFTDSHHKLVFVFKKSDHLKYRERWGTNDNNNNK